MLGAGAGAGAGADSFFFLGVFGIWDFGLFVVGMWGGGGVVGGGREGRRGGWKGEGRRGRGGGGLDIQLKFLFKTKAFYNHLIQI